MSDTQTILYESSAEVATITLNRPQRRNALSAEMIQALTQTLQRARQDAAARVLILTGAGKGFCAGQDLEAFRGELRSNQVYDHIVNFYKPLISLIREMEKPVLAAVNGVAAGAGASLALACDLRLMAEDASLLQPFSKIGLIPDSGSSWFLARQLGFGRAFEMALEAERIPAARCLELGLVNRIVAPEALLAEARAWAEKLASVSALALGLTKKVLNFAATASLLEALEYEARLQQQASEGDDFGRAVQAFFARP